MSVKRGRPAGTKNPPGARVGRPKGTTKATSKPQQIYARCTPAEKERVKLMAKAAGQSESDFIRSRLGLDAICTSCGRTYQTDEQDCPSCLEEDYRP